MLPAIVALLVALVLSAFFTTAELALFSLGESRVRTLADEGYRGSAALERLRERPERVIVLLRLGDALADVAAASVAAYLAYLAWQSYGVALGVAASVLLGAALLILVFGELVPMGIAANHNVRVALAVSPLLLFLCRVLEPPLFLLEKLARAIPRRSAGLAASITESEIRQLTAIGHTEGKIEEHERQIIERAFQLDERKAWDIMTPRVDIFAWPDSLTLAAIAPRLGTVPYSRVPVYGESIDDITGVLYLRDAYQALLAGQRDVPLRQLAREPLIVPGSVPVSKLLRDFQTRRIHLAVVVDEYGGTDGIVTLEDVLEELVGEIADEKEIAEEPPILRVSRTELIAAGDADLREINHILNTSFPTLEHRSLNGFLLEELGRVPEPGEELERDGIVIEVLEATETQVLRARLRRSSPAAEAVGAGGGREGSSDGAEEGEQLRPA
ncbi:MAG TPA: hemolysin family protein [Longimicrobiales bacterium]